MASVVKLTVSGIREYARKVANPELNTVSRWYDVQVTSNETFDGFKYDDDDNKVEAQVNTLTKSAKTWLYAFTATDDNVVACYNLLNAERLDTASDAVVALEARLMLQNATIAISSTLYNEGDELNDVVLNKPTYVREIVAVVPGVTYMEHVFDVLRTNGVLKMIVNTEQTDKQLAEKWVAKQLANLKAQLKAAK